MANDLNLGLNAGTPAFYNSNTPFKDLIKNAPLGFIQNLGVVSGTTFKRIYFAPSSFPHNVSADTNNQVYLYTSETNDENGWPTTLDISPEVAALQPWQKTINYYCIHQVSPGYFSAILPPSSTDNPNEATFHILYEGQALNGGRGWTIQASETEGGGSRFTPTLTYVSAGEYKITGIDTTRMTGFWFQINSEPDPNDHVRNVRIVHQDYRDNFESEPFLPELIRYQKSITTSGGPIRTMKWTGTNNDHFGFLESLDGSTFELSTTLTSKKATSQVGDIGMSYEYIAEYANAVDRDVWICVNARADDSSMSAIASTMANTLNSDRKLYLELGNEWWNTAYPYNLQRTYFTEQAEANGGSSVYYLPEWNVEETDTRWPATEYDMGQAYGVQRSVDLFQIFGNYFSSDRLINVIAGQFVVPDRNKGMLLFSGAYNHVDALAVNPYVGSVLGNQNDSAAAIAASGWDADDLFQFMYDAVSGTEIIPIASRTVTPIRKALTDTKDRLDSKSELSGIEIIGYEGGHHLNVKGSIPSTDKAFLINLIGGTKYDTRWTDWAEYHASTLAEYGMTTFCHFVDMSNWSDDDTTGTWEWFGAIPYPGEETPYSLGLQAYAAQATPNPDPDPGPDPTPPPALATEQLGYRIDINVDININFNT